MSIRITPIDGVAAVEPGAWDALLGPAGSPFQEHAFLSAVEAHSAVPARGVRPRHLVAWEGARPVAALPLYLKADPRGELVYDGSLELLAARLGLAWYPKAVGMSPFTPAEGERVLVAPDRERAPLEAALLQAALEWAGEAGLPGVHLLFLSEAEAARREAQGWLRRLGWQLCWTREGERSLDELLLRLRSKDRVMIKRELRRPAEAGLELEVVEGEAIGEEHRDALWGFWSRTCARHATGSRYLHRGSWDLLFERWRARLVLVCARSARGLEAGALCVHKGDELWGRYWGSRVEVPALYFVLTMYRPLQLLAERGWRRLHLGAGQSDYKLARGCEPEPVHSAHHVLDPRLRQVAARWLAGERQVVTEQIAAVRAQARRRG